MFAALAVTHEIEAATGWSIKRFVQTARRYRTINIRAGDHILTAENPYPTIYATSSPRSPNRSMRTNLA